MFIVHRLLSGARSIELWCIRRLEEIALFETFHVYLQKAPLR